MWRLRKLHQFVDAELSDREQSDGFDLQFFYNGKFSYSRHCATRESALREAADKRAELERDGWMFHW